MASVSIDVVIESILAGVDLFIKSLNVVAVRRQTRLDRWHVQNGTPLHVLRELGGWSDIIEWFKDMRILHQSI